MSQSEKSKSTTIKKTRKESTSKGDSVSYVGLDDAAYEKLSATEFLAAQKELLINEREVYIGQAESLKAEADYLAQEAEPGDVQFDEESGEGGTTTIDRERDLALAASALAAVEEIDDSLRKIEHGSYGKCENCHQEIPRVRLRALPFARLCVQCKSGGLSRR
ncbi:MAG: hypothetical protein HKL84_07255 [Acidimicrobiaceae bacterium]|nr:hypothetical protein [Acidimicrobiaceae bacterium]